MTIELATRKLKDELTKMFSEEEMRVTEKEDNLYDLTLYKSTQFTLNVFNKTGIIGLSNHEKHIVLDKKDFYQISIM